MRVRVLYRWSGAGTVNTAAVCTGWRRMALPAGMFYPAQLPPVLGWPAGNCTVRWWQGWLIRPETSGDGSRGKSEQREHVKKAERALPFYCLKNIERRWATFPAICWAFNHAISSAQIYQD